MTTSFAWVVGQDDNLGDIVLRRRMLRSLLAQTECHLYLRHCSTGFREGLDLGQGAHLYDSLWPWLRALITRRVGGHRVLAFDAGEIRSTPGDALKYALLVPLLLLSRARGDHVVSIGCGTRESRRPWNWVVRRVFGLCSVLIWRDPWSQSVFGIGDTGPDWAFGEPSSYVRDQARDPSERPYLAVSYREGHGPLSDDFLQAVSLAAQRLRLTPVVFVQVRRDAERAGRIAADLDADLLEWGPESHLEQERRVRALLRRSRLVLSDRIHVLIMGLSEGALPLGLQLGPDIKVGRHFAAAGMSGIGRDVSDWTPQQVVDAVVAMSSRGDEIASAATAAAAAVLRYDRLMLADD